GGRTPLRVSLRVQPADHVRVGDAANALHQRRRPEVHAVLVRGVPHAGEGARHQLLQPGDDLRLLPEVVLQPLYPFEIGDDDAARVRQDVGDHGHAAVLEDLIRFRRRGAVGALDHDPGPDAIGVARVDLGRHRRRDQHVARLLEELRIGERVGAGEIDDATAFGNVGFELADVDALRVPDGASEVADPGDHAAVVPKHARGHAADVAEALDHDALAAERLAEALGGLVQHVHDAAPG